MLPIYYSNILLIIVIIWINIVLCTLDSILYNSRQDINKNTIELYFFYQTVNNCQLYFASIKLIYHYSKQNI